MKITKAIAGPLFSVMLIAVCGYGQSSVGVLPAVTSKTSPVWSGYVVPTFAGSVTDVKGSWIVPSASCTLGSFTKSSFWVGMDGYDTGSSGPEQIGTHSDCSILGYPVYYAFYEFVCGFACGKEITISTLTISAGDTISAEVSYGNGLFAVTLTDVTSGAEPFTKSVSFTKGHQSDAECIAEDPVYAGVFPYKLSNFGTVDFGYYNTGQANTCYATVNGTAGPIGSFGNVTALTMKYKGVVEAVPSSLSDLSSFSVNYVVPNTWSSGAPMPVAADGTAVAALKDQIYVIGGGNDSGILANTQIYNPATNTWGTGVPLPTATVGGCAAVVSNVLYFIGGNTGGQGYTGTVWAYSPKMNTWSPKAPMPTARSSMTCVAENGVIYAMGGYNGEFLGTVESYDAATDTWTELAPMLSVDSDAGGGGGSEPRS